MIMDSTFIENIFETDVFNMAFIFLPTANDLNNKVPSQCKDRLSM